MSLKKLTDINNNDIQVESAIKDAKGQSIHSTYQEKLTTTSVSDGTINKVIGFDTNGDIVKGTQSGGGMTNPMTTAGDIIIGGSSGTATRLGIGTYGSVLSVNSNYQVVMWEKKTINLEAYYSYQLHYDNPNSGSESEIIAFGITYDSNYNYYKKYQKLYIGQANTDDGTGSFYRIIKFYCTSADGNDVLTGGQLYDLTANVLMNGSGQFTNGHEYLLLSSVYITNYD